MLQQHPIVAAPAASPERFKIIPRAAELIGSVRIIPISTETTIPMINGCCSVPQLMIAPSPVINLEIGGPTIRPTAHPVTIVTIGVTRISTFVLPETRCPSSIPANAATNAPSGSPGPARTTLPSTRSEPARILLANPPVMPAVAAESTSSRLS